MKKLPELQSHHDTRGIPIDQVTMQAYNNPVFVEDVVRNAASQLKDEKRVTWFEIRAVNHESIHDHSAFAVICSTARA